jgi:hypothetical protein
MLGLHPSSVIELDVGLMRSGISASLITGEEEGVNVSGHSEPGRGSLASKGNSVVSAEGRARALGSSRLDFSDMSKRGSSLQSIKMEDQKDGLDCFILSCQPTKAPTKLTRLTSSCEWTS